MVQKTPGLQPTKAKISEYYLGMKRLQFVMSMKTWQNITIDF